MRKDLARSAPMEPNVRSAYRGVSFDRKKRKFRVQIKVTHLGKSGISVGYYESEVDAAKAYDRAAIALLGRSNGSLVTNFPLGDYESEQIPCLIGKERDIVKKELKVERLKHRPSKRGRQKRKTAASAARSKSVPNSEDSDVAEANSSEGQSKGPQQDAKSPPKGPPKAPTAAASKRRGLRPRQSIRKPKTYAEDDSDSEEGFNSSEEGDLSKGAPTGPQQGPTSAPEDESDSSSGDESSEDEHQPQVRSSSQDSESLQRVSHGNTQSDVVSAGRKRAASLEQYGSFEMEQGNYAPPDAVQRTHIADSDKHQEPAEGPGEGPAEGPAQGPAQCPTQGPCEEVEARVGSNHSTPQRKRRRSGSIDGTPEPVAMRSKKAPRPPLRAPLRAPQAFGPGTFCIPLPPKETQEIMFVRKLPEGLRYPCVMPQFFNIPAIMLPTHIMPLPADDPAEENTILPVLGFNGRPVGQMGGMPGEIPGMPAPRNLFVLRAGQADGRTDMQMEGQMSKLPAMKAPTLDDDWAVQALHGGFTPRYGAEGPLEGAPGPWSPVMEQEELMEMGLPTDEALLEAPADLHEWNVEA